MPGGRRGLVAPQNTFLDVLIKRAAGQPDTSFIIVNAQIVDYPIVYCSEEFSKLLGFKRSEVMQQPIRCDFMVGTLTDKSTIDKMLRALSAHEGGVYEILYYKKNGHGIWLQEEVTPIKNEQDTLVLFLVSFRDITAFREPVPGGGMMTNLSKFAKLAWTMTRSRQQAAAAANASGGNAIPGKSLTIDGGSNTLVNKSSIETLAINTDSNTTPNVNHVSKSSNLDNRSVIENSTTDAVITEAIGNSTLSPSKENKVNGDKALKAHQQEERIGSRESGIKHNFTDSLPQYRHEPPKSPPHILLHYSYFKVCWDWIILGLTFYTVVIVPYNLAFNKAVSNDGIVMMVINSIVDVIFFIDIIFNFHTSFVGADGSVIVDEKKIRQNYLRSGFLIDVMACLPYDALNIFSSSDQPDGSTGYGNIFMILKVMRLFRLGRVARAMHRFLESSFALLLLMLSFYVIVAHWFACVFYVIGREDLKQGIQHGWLSELSNTTGAPFILLMPDGIDDNSDNINDNSTIPSSLEPRIEGGPPMSSMYLTALYFTMTCMTSIGFGNVAAETDNEKLFTLFMMIISSLLYAAIFGHVTTIIHNMTLATAKYHETLNSVKEFMMLNEVPRTLTERVMDYVVSKWANTKGVDQEKVLSVCPKDMRADICVHLNRRVFNGCPAFRLASDGCLRALAVGFEMTHSAPGDFIFRKGESIKELGFVASGSLEVIQDGEILALLGQGDVFGDATWKEKQLAKSAVHVRALTYCDIHMINVEKLNEVLEFYKAFAQTFSRNLTLTYDLSKRTVFYKVAEKRLERILGAVQHHEPPFTPAQVTDTVSDVFRNMYSYYENCLPYMTNRLFERRFTVAHPSYTDREIQLLKRAVSKFRGQVNVDENEVVEGSDDNNENSRTRRIQSVSGGSPLMKNSGRRKSQNTAKSVTIKTSTSSVPTPGYNRRGVASSASNDVILHVGGQAWTRESLAYGTSRESSRPNSAHGSSSNIQHRKSIDQSSLISSSSITNQQIPSLRPTSSDSLTHQISGTQVTKVAGDYVQSKAENSFSSFSEQPQDYHSIIKFVDEQNSHDVKNNLNVEIVQKAFKEYKDDINQSLSDLDTKIDRLESMITILVERMPQAVVPHNTVTTGKKNDSKSADEENSNQLSDITKDS